MSGRVGLQASPTGHGCGVALVQLDSRILQVNVVPKFWAPTGDVVADLNSPIAPNATNGKPLQKVLVHEKQRLIMHGGGEDLRLAVTGLTGLQFDEDGEGDSQPPGAAHAEQAAQTRRATKVGMFTELPRVTGLRDIRRAQPTLPPEQAMSSFFDLVISAGATDLLRTPAGEADLPAYLANTLLPHVAELRPLLLRHFVETTERAVVRRRPRFTTHAGHLPAVRGRIEMADLPRRTARRSLAIRCSFDDLDPDTPWQRLVRSALRMAQAELSDDRPAAPWQDRIHRIDRRMSDVALMAPRQALAGTAHQRPPRSERAFRESIALGVALIRGRYPFGTQEYADALSPGVAAGVHLSTARLFEHLLTTVVLPGGARLQRNTEGLKIRDDGGPRKQPDLVATIGDLQTHLLDAKYKLRDASPHSGDQYQQYAYASASGLPTGLVYVHTRESAPPACSPIVRSGQPSDIRVGQASVPFPGPGQALDDWQQVAGELLGDLLNELGAPPATAPPQPA